MTSAHRKGSGARSTGQPSPLTRLGWCALLAYFPLLLWLLQRLPPTGRGAGLLALRVALFHGAGALWSTLLLRWEGRLAEFKALTSRPGRGLRHGVYGFVAIAGAATLLLRLPSGMLPAWLPVLLHPLDLTPVYADPRLPTGPGGLPRLLLLMAGGAAEEWIFRCAIWLRWAGALPVQTAPSGEAKSAPMTLGYEFKLTMVCAYFAWLHWPQGPWAMLLAFLGGMVLGGVLWWRRSFWLIATLHALYNWNSL